MTWRMQPPVYSPLSLGAVIAGAGALLSGDGAAAEGLARELADEFSAAHVLLTDSGTTALALAIRAAAGEGLVALPAYGCYDLATAVDTAGARPILYDLDPSTLGPDWNSLGRALEQGARAVVAVHLFGVPVDLARMAALAESKGVLLIEDAAMGTGALCHGVPAGATAPLGILSFGRGKGVTGGHGGALLIKDGAPVIAPLDQGSTSAKEILPLFAQWLLARPTLYGIPARLPFLGLGETVYRPVGALRQISRVAVGTLGRTRPMRQPEAMVRKANAARLLAARRASWLRSVRIEAGGEAGYLRLPLIADETTRAQRLDPVARALGIMPGYPLSLDVLPGFRDRLAGGGQFPGAHALAAGLLTLPTHSQLTEADLRRLDGWLAR